MSEKNKYPYLAYSELTKRVYIVLNGNNDKIDVTEQYEAIVKEREKV